MKDQNLPAIADLPVQSMAEIATCGELLAQAGFLGCKNQGEGFVVMIVCQQTGMSLFEYQQKYHYRQGQFSMQAHAILASFEDRGGTYELIERTPERAAIKLKKGDNEYLSELTWKDALEEPFVYRGNETTQLAELQKPQAQRRIKAKYSTRRARMQMLWARVISDGVVVVDPGARMGIYPPEVTEDFNHNKKEEKVIEADEVVVKNIVESVIDYTVCPLEPKKGWKWTEMSTADLLLVLNVPSESFNASNPQLYRNEINKILNERKKNE